MPENEAFPTLTPSQRVLLGPGPSDTAPSVLRAIGQPTLGHLDPELLVVQNQIRAMLRPILGTDNDWTFATSGTGTSGMEACLAGLIQAGDEVLVEVHGYFGLRMVEMATRFGAKVTAVEGEWGRAADMDALRAAAAAKRPSLLCVVQAETSTGVHQRLEPMAELARELDCLLLVDAVTSLACMPVETDAHGIDAVYSCTQKGLSCPPGLSPVSFSKRAADRIRARTQRGSFYLDCELLMDYWSGNRSYHHTASSNLYFALHEALRLVLEEGLEQRFERHRAHGSALRNGIEAMGLELLVAQGEHLPQLCSVRIPEGVDDARVRARLLKTYGIEIGGGLGPLKGRIWRIGMMGWGSSARNVTLLLAALGAALAAEGFRGGGNCAQTAEEIMALATDLASEELAARAGGSARVGARIEGLLRGEREACAQLVESRVLSSGHASDQLREAAKAIRGRG